MSGPGEDLAQRAPLSERLHAVSLLLHRWVGLVIAAFLSVAGLTGSVIAFYPELDRLLNPELFEAAPPQPGAALLDPIELRERFQAQITNHELSGVILHVPPGRTVNYWVDGREVFVNPYDARIQGARTFGTLKEGKWSVLTFLYEFHFSLALGEVGTWLFGVVGLLWTIDCCVAAYLTFPRRAAHSSKRSERAWLVRWLRAWKLKSNTLFTLVFTWHRASGLWVWGFLFVFAWSAVALNLHDAVYVPVMDVAMGKHEHKEPKELDVPRARPALGTRAALAIGRQLMAAEAQQRDFRVFQEHWLSYEAEHGTYVYTVDSSLDIDPRLASTAVVFDGEDGRQLDFHAPSAGARATVDIWLIGLHFGRIRAGGLAYRAFVCLLGVAVALLSVTGVWIWLRKRRLALRAPGSR